MPKLKWYEWPLAIGLAVWALIAFHGARLLLCVLRTLRWGRR